MSTQTEAWVPLLACEAVPPMARSQGLTDVGRALLLGAILDLARAVAHMHAMRVVHSDISSENALVDVQRLQDQGHAAEWLVVRASDRGLAGGGARGRLSAAAGRAQLRHAGPHGP